MPRLLGEFGVPSVLDSLVPMVKLILSDIMLCPTRCERLLGMIEYTRGGLVSSTEARYRWRQMNRIAGCTSTKIMWAEVATETSRGSDRFKVRVELHC